MKKFISLMLAMALTLTMVACGSTDNASGKQSEKDKAKYNEFQVKRAEVYLDYIKAQGALVDDMDEQGKAEYYMKKVDDVFTNDFELAFDPSKMTSQELRSEISIGFNTLKEENLSDADKEKLANYITYPAIQTLLAELEVSSDYTYDESYVFLKEAVLWTVVFNEESNVKQTEAFYEQFNSIQQEYNDVKERISNANQALFG